jgi:hypothetical protein
MAKMADRADDKTITAHNEIESLNLPPTTHKFQFSSRSKKQDGDVALALFANADDLHIPVDPEEEKKLIRKIDLLILPLIAVCYSFFYIDKTTLSYAAIFGIREDLNLHGTQYSWLSSKWRKAFQKDAALTPLGLFYFGFLAWAFPTNFLMQRLPLGKYLGFKYVGCCQTWQLSATFGAVTDSG